MGWGFDISQSFEATGCSGGLRARLKMLGAQWAADHTATLAGGQTILVLDMYEHAYHMVYGAKAACVDAFASVAKAERVLQWPRRKIGRLADRSVQLQPGTARSRDHDLLIPSSPLAGCTDCFSGGIIHAPP